MSRILIIDDEPLMRISIGDALKGEGYEVSEAASGREGLGLAKDGGFDVVITDLRLPDIDGLEVLRSLRKSSPETMVILITAFGAVETAVEAMKYGAYDYVTKPFAMDELLIMIRRMLKLKELERENQALKEQVEGRYNFSGIVGRSEKMNEIFEMIKVISQTDSTVLILGESGTGKEIVASAIHRNSPRKDGPYIKVSCAAIPETLLEAELFGYDKGAFTGAVKQKKGRFELADKGTIFLDEIGELAPSIQVKLLRVLQEKEFDRLGGTGTVSADVRVICATQRDLKKEVQNGSFREDLYYRLNVVPIVLPPLRERKGDIILLANHFLNYYSGLCKKQVKGFSVDAVEALIKYPFPGNVRELEHAVERAVVMGKGEEIQPWDLPEEIGSSNLNDCLKVFRSGPDGHENLTKAMKDFEKKYIIKVLEETNGNKTLAARLLGVSRKTLWEKCKILEIISGE
ncbi:MAG: sigma-54-dependent Fis family transcriptional regulator [Deltaproteobacteria bacterium]|nr:sigma-54-dependent Fis family transcriptional regulator [Deltaproteobacteria bacterium]MBZ0220616.1 sigma-54 dependent transcriptional regulator [Deltaproteobacteria bacterium]